jgi:hypothetical protein
MARRPSEIPGIISRAAGVTATVALAVALFGGTASAQLPADPKANPPAPARPPVTAHQDPTTPPERVVPPSPDVGKSFRGAETGVLHPPENVDPGMKMQTPDAGRFPMPVIPPGGANGNQPRAVPK